MSPQDFLETFRRSVGALPFPMEDSAAVVDHFRRWQAGDAAARETTALWAYLFLLRYFARKFLPEGRRGASDMDALFTETYARVLARADQVHTPEQFPGWVAVVAQNAFRTYLRQHPAALDLHDDYDAEDEDAPDPLDGFDTPALRAALALALDRLPDSLRPIAVRRLVDQVDYETLAEETGRDLGLLRSYTKKALDRLRQDPGLRAVWGVA